MNNVILLLLLLLLAFGSDAQSEWVGQKFKSDVLIGSAKSKTGEQVIQLSTLEAKNPWGYFVVFNADGTFFAFNQISCGLDCRKKLKGEYKVAENKVEIIVHEIRYCDICATKSAEISTYTYGTFEISDNEEGFVLKRVF